MEAHYDKVPRPAWVNEIVLNRYSSLSRAQQEEIWGEFEVWATTRGIRKAQAKRHGLDESIKTLSLHGNHNNFDAAFTKAMMFIDRNGKEGVAKDKHLQDALRQKAREKAAMRKAEVRAAMREAQENWQQHKYQKLHPQRQSDDLWYMQTWAFWDQSGWWDSWWSCNQQQEWLLQVPPGLQVPSYEDNSQGQFEALYEFFGIGVDKDVSEKSPAGESTESICGGLGSGLSEDKNLLERVNDGEPASSNQGCILEKQKNKYADSSWTLWWNADTLVPRKVDLKETHNHWHNPKVTQEIAEDESETVADNLEKPMIEDPGQEWLASDHSVKKAEDSEQGALTLINENAKEPTFEDDADENAKNIKEPTFEDDAHEEADDSEQKALPLTDVNVKEPLLAHDTDEEGEQVAALTDPYFEEEF